MYLELEASLPPSLLVPKLPLGNKRFKLFEPTKF